MTTITTNTAVSHHTAFDGVKGAAKSAIEFAEMIRDRIRIQSALSTLKPKDLRDIGLTEHDVQSIQHMPLSHDVASTLHTKSLHQSRNW